MPLKNASNAKRTRITGSRAVVYDILRDIERDPSTWEYGDVCWQNLLEGTTPQRAAKVVNEISEEIGLGDYITNPKNKLSAYAVLDHIFEHVAHHPEAFNRLRGYRDYADSLESEERAADYEAYQESVRMAKHEKTKPRVRKVRKLKAPSARAKQVEAIVPSIGRKARQAVSYIPYKAPAISRAAATYVPYAGPAVAAGETVDKGLSLANTAMQSLTQALTTDLIVLKGQIQRGTKRKPKTPINYEIHGNALGGALIVVGIGAFLWMADLRIGPYKDKIYYGYWEWRRGPQYTSPQHVIRSPRVEWTDAQLPEKPAPHTFPEIGHWEYDWSGEGTHKGPTIRGGYSSGALVRRWVVDAPEVTVEPVLKYEGERYIKRWGLHERYHDKNAVSDVIANPLVSPMVWIVHKLRG